MALWRCTSCTAAYAVGAPCCPQCGHDEHEEDGVMPKSNESGVSYAGQEDVSPDGVTQPDWQPVEGETELVAVEGSDDQPSESDETSDSDGDQDADGGDEAPKRRQRTRGGRSTTQKQEGHL